MEFERKICLILKRIGGRNPIPAPNAKVQYPRLDEAVNKAGYFVVATQLTDVWASAFGNLCV